MIKLLGINLLPYREIARQKKQKEFNRLVVLAVIAGLGLGIFTYVSISGIISNQQSKNQILTDGIAKLDAQIKKVNALKETKRSFLARKQKIEELQNERFKAAKIFNDLNVLMPEGTYLTSLQTNGDSKYTLVGKATTDNQVAMFMNSLPSTGLFTNVELVNIRSTGDSQEFTLHVDLVDHTKDKVGDANNN